MYSIALYIYIYIYINRIWTNDRSNYINNILSTYHLFTIVMKTGFILSELIEQIDIEKAFECIIQ
jgi:hypothetical protein